MSYNRNNQNQFIHPFTFFLVDKLNLIYGLIQDVHYRHAAKATSNLILFLDPEIQTVLEEKGYKKILETWVYGKVGLNEYPQPLTKESLDELLQDIFRCLHVAGYFAAAKFGPTTKTTTIGDLKTKLETAILKKKVKAKRKEREADVKD